MSCGGKKKERWLRLHRSGNTLHKWKSIQTCDWSVCRAAIRYSGPIWTICPKIVPLPWTIIYAKFPKDVLSLCFFSEQTAWICRVLISPVNCPSLSDIGLSNRPALLIIYVELMYAYWPQNVESKPVGLIHTQEVFGIKVWHYKSDLPNVIRKKERILTYW